ncbi:MAG: hypothetical protein J5781_06380 [Clostridia bacterium]|nr:hypothetical protein [Clostridia bacterium]
MLLYYVFIRVLKKKYGDFYTLQEAYEQGLISKDDLKSISYYNSDGFHEFFEQSAQDIKELSENDVTKIKEEYVRLRHEEGKETKTSEVKIKYSYGLYRQCIALLIGETAETEESRTETVLKDGYEFSIHYDTSAERAYVFDFSSETLLTLEQAGELPDRKDASVFYLCVDNQRIVSQMHNFTPSDNFGTISFSVKQKIRSDYAHQKNFKKSKTVFAGYFGKYNDLYAVNVYALDESKITIQAACVYEIDSVLFAFPYAYRNIILWKNKQEDK